MPSTDPKDLEFFLKLIAQNWELSKLLILSLSEEQRNVAYDPTINIPIWEFGHVSYFYEQKVLRTVLPSKIFLAGADDLFDSIAINHQDRWQLPMPSTEQILQYGEVIRESLKNCLKRDMGINLRALCFALYHEQMHHEAYLYTRQNLGIENPLAVKSAINGEFVAKYAAIPEGEFFVGTGRTDQFIFDNERWGGVKKFSAFEIAAYPVTVGQFKEFVDDGGYENEKFWPGAAGRWLKTCGRSWPLYWQIRDGEYFLKSFSEWKSISDFNNQPCQFINWYEANAYCLWSGTRLPTEWEWQLAASLVKPSKFPALQVKCWNEDQFPNVNFMGVNNSLANVEDFPESKTYFGCSQMLGNTWEWTSSAHFPLDGYKVDEVYAEYSATSFGYHKVLKGGSWASNAHFVSNNFRNFYLPHRSDVFAGFRVCKS